MSQPGIAPQPDAPVHDSLLPGSIGIVVERAAAGVVVAAVRQGGAAAAAGVHSGDVVVRYNGAAVSSVRGFYLMVLDSRPGSVARLELQRGGALRRVEMTVRQLDTMPRG